ncbi:hypothetical protein M011DRAFT_496053 [Sporormia fimetaria CBS 119925]|uniref:Rhodopsin domain-containing protein n=1 Tax=Sporormia fimetaria CBS 119925 TaxID=1340428 RepID=A0A6A6V4G8_9PLEO|nr:hypothetical protein M011DRAFT_496053 [Sporormia fimetaria CBS 119925]
MNVPAIISATIGFGRDIWSIPPEGITDSLRLMYVAYIFYMLTLCLCQLSILAFCLRLLVDQKTRYIAWCLVAICSGFGIGNVFSMVLQCVPVSGAWEGWKGEMSATCIDQNLYGFIRGGIQIALDLAILVLPLPTVFRLQMSLWKKLRLASMFCVGFVITIVSCLRLYALIRFNTSQNPTYDNTSGIYWCGVEANLFLIVACMPAVNAILRKVFGRGRNGSKISSSKGSYPLDRFSRQHKSAGSIPFGVITKSTKVDMCYTERDRSSSDLELVKSGSHEYPSRNQT